jgi:murein DD-endopeptidase MepM/ murein hydrolase activator NlpD
VNRAATAILLLLAAVAFNQVRAGTFGTWLRSKVFNAGDPNRRPSSLADGLEDQGAGGSSVTPAGVQTGGWLTPASGPVSSPYGPRNGRMHHGIDLAAPTGSPVRAARAGRVTWSGSKGTAGIAVEIDHGDGWSSRYYHLSRSRTRVGATVGAGELIGDVGSTGRSTGPHLHFEIRRNGSSVDPAPYVGASAAVAV